MRVLLFDIDGTLQTSPGIGRLAFQRTLTRLIGSGAGIEGIRFAGRVDWAIWREVLAVHGYTHAAVDARLTDFAQLYEAELAALLANADDPKPALLPGALALLREVAADGSLLSGLVTGNTENAARLKLEYTRIAGYFRFGAFGNEAYDRNILPSLAIERASRFANGRQFSGADVIVIGDTIHDIACARAVGAKVIAVATGMDDEDTLWQAGADVVLPSLEDVRRVLDLIHN